MAIIQSIRNRGGLLIGIIGVALLLFLLSDFFSNRGTGGRRSSPNVAEVNGQGIPYELYQSSIAEQEELYKMQTGQSMDASQNVQVSLQIWQELINEAILEREVNKLGITVQSSELLDLIGGENPHPIIVQNFADPQTGMVNRAMLYNFIQQMREEDNVASPQRTMWLFLEDMIYKQRLSMKYTNLINKGMYVTNFEAQTRQNERSKSVDFSMVARNFSEISDSAITVSDSDIKKYYNENQAKYKQEESREIRYVQFDVLPRDVDYKDAESWIDGIYSEFDSLEADRTEQFVNLNSDPDSRFDQTNYGKGELPSTLDSFAFSAQPGDVYGPYFENEAYKIAKLAKINYMPDSVKARHILLPVNQENVNVMRQLADSLFNLVEDGYDFATLAKEHSQDGSAADGGDLGWFKEGQMVKPFSDSCFYGKTGDFKMVFSQFGIHIINITQQSRPTKKVQVGILSRGVRVSNETLQHYYTEAIDFASYHKDPASFDEALKTDKSLEVHEVSELRQAGNMQLSITNPREMVVWAYNNEENTVSPVFKMDDSYVVAILDKINKKGIKPLKDVEDEIKREVMLAKKAEMLTAELNNALAEVNSIDELAAKFNTNPETFSGINMATYTLQGAGRGEESLIGASQGLELSTMSPPISGINGVYVIYIDQVNENEVNVPLSMEKSNIKRSLAAQANAMPFRVLYEMADVKDYRAIQ